MIIGTQSTAFTYMLSQSQLAFEAGVTREFVNKLESGNYNISIRNLEKIAQILNVEIKDLFFK